MLSILVFITLARRPIYKVNYSWDVTRQIALIIERVNQLHIQAELKQLCSQGKRICLVGDLTGIPVSNTSRTYTMRLVTTRMSKPC